MSLFKKTSALLVAVLFSANVLAGKVVVFDHQEAMLRTELAQKAITDVQASAEYQQLVQQGEALKADLAALKKEFDAEGMTWSNEIKTLKNSEAENIQKSLQLAAKQAQTMQAAAVGKIAEEMQPKLEQILKDIVEAEKIDIILQKQVSYTANESADITLRVTEKLNAAMK